MTQKCLEVHDLVIGDSLTPLGAQLFQDGEIVDLTGKDVYFLGVSENGDAWINETLATIVDENAGKVQYAFSASQILEGRYYGYFLVYNGAHTKHDTYPAGGRKLSIVVHGH